MSFKKFKACLTATIAMLAVLVTTAVFAAAEGTIDWGNGTIQVTGNGVGKAKYKNSSPGQYRLTARQAARMDAQRKLAEYVNGVHVTGSSSMSDLALEDDKVATVLQGVVLKNALEVGDPKFFEDGTCEVKMELRLYGGGGSLSEAAYLPFKDEPKVDFPKPSVNVPTVASNYTGLIIDCRGKNINPVMSPVIKNSNGQAIYGHQNLNYDKIIVNGMASYANDVNDQISRSRAGSNPIVVQATGLDDLNANPVISVADADKILAANQQSKFLENCAVVFVK
ncbi:MAG: hypothetical protein IJQ82_00235 [Selenomonadaceae bacterium]|nr:hypothetical protein [Selenomonadaceae bacterium]